eukprot:m.58242 g.58242  ORF g.58242 m.58242 type:complete len:70 (+) comp15639_c0_seq20:2014-2223(+)
MNMLIPWDWCVDEWCMQADMLSQSDIAVELARMDKLGSVLSDRTSFFFGSQPNDMAQLLSNPAVVQGRQ